MFLQTLNIEWGQIDPKDNRRVKHLIFKHLFKHFYILDQMMLSMLIKNVLILYYCLITFRKSFLFLIINLF